ncbi:MAG: ABC transporter ATP-binding protein [Oscillospiraceae bacterium]|jgi:iron complex transport system ATP-binding protein|nr:ABC transporter ATP-binding protein [Oscillospiraceae bacterium]
MSVVVENLSFSYGKRRVLDGVSFEAREGEMLCVLGPNGVGKSTLFNCILGLAPAESGEIRVDGEAVGNIGVRELARRIAFVPQSHAPTFNYSVFDMVLMGTTAHVGGISAPGAEQMLLAENALERVGISHLRERGYMQISGGERQLTLIARALAQQSGVIIMDEPTANLDYGNQLRVLMRVKELVREGMTVIQSTHNPDHAFLFADRVLALIDGRVAADGPPAEAVTESLIESLYGVRVKLTRGDDGAIHCHPILN